MSESTPVDPQEMGQTTPPESKPDQATKLTESVSVALEKSGRDYLTEKRPALQGMAQAFLEAGNPEKAADITLQIAHIDAVHQQTAALNNLRDTYGRAHNLR